MSEFYQDPPQLKNTFTGHRWLKAYLRHKLPQAQWAEVESDLERLGDACASEYLQLARTAEREKPQLVAFDPWGKRVDEIRVSPAWVELQNIAAREGLIHIGYKRAQGEYSRLYQFAKLYLFHPSSAFFTCPLAMADGAAKVLENFGVQPEHRNAFEHLTSNDPKEFWTSGQWMTERSGGSDVSGTETVSRTVDGVTRLFGTKWFSSATTSQIALALARPDGFGQGGRSLTLYMVPTYTQPGELNHIRVLRLKDKLGTWALPTAELQLEGSLAYPIGEVGQGIKIVANMLNITRLYNSICSVGQMTRPLEMLRDYSARRKVFGLALNEHVMHYQTFAQEELKLLSGFLLTMELVHILGREECGVVTHRESAVLRLMTPVCKLFTARSAVQVASECVEGFGGAGYIEDTGIPVHLRDSQVFPIWEGATNVLLHDMLRVLQKSPVIEDFQQDILSRLKGLRSDFTAPYRDWFIAELSLFGRQFDTFAKSPADMQLGSSRGLAFYLGKAYAFALLLEWADRHKRPESFKAWLDLYKSEYWPKWVLTEGVDVSAARDVWHGQIEF